MPDYAAEQKSRFEMWWCFGWPYETSVAMARLVFSGVFDRHPDLKIVTHHLGGGMIPFFDGRIGAGMEVLGARTSDEDYSKVLSSLKRPHLDYFHDFYADTALFGAGNGLQCGLDFFGADKVVFATDAPLGPIAKTIAAVETLDLDAHHARDHVGQCQEAVEARLILRSPAKAGPVLASTGSRLRGTSDNQPAMLAQEPLARRGHLHPRAALARHRPAHHQPAVDRILPHGQARTRGAPRVEHVGVGARLLGDPFDEVEHQRIEIGGFAHGSLRAHFNPATAKT